VTNKVIKTADAQIESLTAGLLRRESWNCSGEHQTECLGY